MAWHIYSDSLQKPNCQTAAEFGKKEKVVAKKKKKKKKKKKTIMNYPSCGDFGLVPA